jgi:hypothetical protein
MLGISIPSPKTLTLTIILISLSSFLKSLNNYYLSYEFIFPLSVLIYIPNYSSYYVNSYILDK